MSSIVQSALPSQVGLLFSVAADEISKPLACLTLIRINISGSIDYHQLIQTLRKRTYDIGGNAIGVYDYQERRRVLVNQHGYEIEKDEKTNYFFKPKEFKYVLVKDNQKLAKITADIFKCKQKVS